MLSKVYLFTFRSRQHIKFFGRHFLVCLIYTNLSMVRTHSAHVDRLVHVDPEYQNEKRNSIQCFNITQKSFSNISL